MFDCVWPTRTAVRLPKFAKIDFVDTDSHSQRFGNAITSTGVLNLKHSSFAEDFLPIESHCTCPCCRPKELGGLGITKAYIYHLAAKETVGAHL